jgi:uncharacterized protein
MRFSKFVFKYKYILPEETLICLFHSLSLKKVYLTPEEFNEIVKRLKNNEVNKEIQKLKELKFVVDENYNEEKEILKVINEKSIKYPRPRLSYIFLTDSCNFRCKYCFVENKEVENKKIDKELADKIIEVIKNNSNGVKNYKISFYGGEPLLNFEVLKYITEKLHSISKEKYKFGIVTNGSLITDEIAEFFKKYNFGVGISLDGWYELNKYRVYKDGRPTFFDTLRGFSILKQHGLNPSISCTVSKINYTYLPKIVEFFYNLGVKGIGFNLILDQPTRETYGVSDPKLLAYYMFEAFKRCVELGIFEDRIGRRRAEPLFQEQPRFYDCPGYGMQIAFSPKGTISPCQAFFTTNLFQEEIKPNFKASESKVLREWVELGGPLSNKDCWKCPAIGICGGSCPYDYYINNKKLGFKDEYFCEFIKEILRLLLIYYHKKEIKKIEVQKLAPEYIKGFKQLIESLKNEKVKMDLENVDVDRWIENSITFQKIRNFGFFLAIDLSKNKVVGFSNILRNITKEKKYNIQNFFEIGIAVEKEYRRKGIGTMLLKHVLENAKKLKIEKVFVDIHKDNLVSIAFFKKNGFKEMCEKDGRLIHYKIV